MCLFSRFLFVFFFVFAFLFAIFSRSRTFSDSWTFFFQILNFFQIVEYILEYLFFLNMWFFFQIHDHFHFVNTNVKNYFRKKIIDIKLNLKWVMVKACVNLIYIKYTYVYISFHTIYILLEENPQNHDLYRYLSWKDWSLSVWRPFTRLVT